MTNAAARRDGAAGDPVARALAVAAWAATCFYVGWNAFWLSLGALPPSILQHFTGVPVPTTGLTRSLLAALDGSVATSLAWNAFALPIVALCLLSAGCVGQCVASRRRVALPGHLARAWGVVLAAAWIVKLIQGPQWW